MVPFFVPKVARAAARNQMISVGLAGRCGGLCRPGRAADAGPPNSTMKRSEVPVLPRDPPPEGPEEPRGTRERQLEPQGAPSLEEENQAQVIEKSHEPEVQQGR